MTKRCRGCGQEKALDEFHRHRRDGLQSRCKDCKRAAVAEWKRQNPDKVREKRERERDRDAQRRRAVRQREPERFAAYQRKADIKRKFGLTVEEYEALTAEGCGVCGALDGQICVDHDHRRGHVRGVLCGRCNTALGLMRDDPDLIFGLAEYLLTDVLKRGGATENAQGSCVVSLADSARDAA